MQDNNNFTILQGAHPLTRQTRISENQTELDCGMKILDYEPLDIEFDNDKRLERIIHYKKDNKVITFYVTPEPTVGMKILSLDNGITKTTSVFHSISIENVPAILKMTS